MSEANTNIGAIRLGERVIAVITPTKDGWHTQYLNGHEPPANDSFAWSMQITPEAAKLHQQLHTLTELATDMAAPAARPEPPQGKRSWSEARLAKEAEKKRIKAAETVI